MQERFRPRTIQNYLFFLLNKRILSVVEEIGCEISSQPLPRAFVKDITATQTNLLITLSQKKCTSFPPGTLRTASR